MSNQLLVNLDEVAQSLSLSRRSVQALIYRGELPSVTIGRCRRIAVADLEAFVRRLGDENAGGAPAPASEEVRRVRAGTSN